MRCLALFFATAVLSAGQIIPDHYIVEFETDPAVVVSLARGARFASGDNIVQARRTALRAEHAQAEQVRRIRSVLASVYSQMKDNVHYEEQMQLMLKADSADATTCNDLGYFWADQNRNLDEAERLIPIFRSSLLETHC